MARQEKPKTPLARRLVEVRKALGFEEREKFAAGMGCKSSTFGSYERGDREPKSAFYRNYRQRFAVNLNWLFTGEGEMLGDVSAPQNQEALNRERMTVAINAVEEGLEGKRFPIDKKAELILAAYDMLAEDYDNKDNIIRLINRAV